MFLIRCSKYVKYKCRSTIVTSKDASSDHPLIRESGPEHTHNQEPLTKEEFEVPLMIN